jgi:hypothetical protein
MSVTPYTERQWFTSHVRAVMSAILAKPVEPDVDGDFPVQGETTLAWVRADPNDLWGAQVFALAAQGVPLCDGSLREINEVNLHEIAIKVSLDSDGSVWVMYRLLADAVTEDNLAAAMRRIIGVADRIGPLLTAVYGGATPISLQSPNRTA